MCKTHLGWYYLAGLTWLLEIIMFASIIFLPLVLWLKDNYQWFEKPFNTAYFK